MADQGHVERAQTRRRVCRLAAALELTRIAAAAEWGTVSEESGDREQVLRFRDSAILAGTRGIA